MTLMDESVWRGKIYSGGWVGGDLGIGLTPGEHPVRRDRRLRHRRQVRRGG